jgi:hypothetical protein
MLGDYQHDAELCNRETGEGEKNRQQVLIVTSTFC